ncbi:hypothetical protein [Wukongibacter sp. M2B1]|uniref:hypothetical protein n=1 Tax=Wukongibacter sp. M2B1 TaxID=3088895 RepID=UPI003D7B0B9D
MIVSNCGLEVDNKAVMTFVKNACTIGIALSVLNNSATFESWYITLDNYNG